MTRKELLFLPAAVYWKPAGWFPAPREGKMPGTVVLIVLCGAFLHANWNAVVKSGGDKFLNAVMVVLISGVAAAIILPFLTPPSQASWPFLLFSTFLQVVYLVLVAKAYSAGDMSLAYPVMRGTAPLLVALASGPLIGEALPLLRWVGIALVSGGILTMALDSAGRGEARKATLTIALVNAVFIAAYTVTDGIGVRKSGSPIAYTLWIFVFHAIPMVVYALASSAAAFADNLRKRWRAATFGAFATLAAYGSALWAMSLDVPVASVAALRETSILFAAGLAVFLFGERIGPWRWLGVALICAGVATIRIA